MHSDSNADLPSADSSMAEAARLMALALEIISPRYLEGLSVDNQAHILGLDVLEVREYLRETINELGVQASAATLIVEDKAAVAPRLGPDDPRAGSGACSVVLRTDSRTAAR